MSAWPSWSSVCAPRSERTLELLAALDEDHVLISMGFRPNALSLTEALSDHDNSHADDIVNGPMMMSSR